MCCVLALNLDTPPTLICPWITFSCFFVRHPGVFLFSCARVTLNVFPSLTRGGTLTAHAPRFFGFFLSPFPRWFCPRSPYSVPKSPFCLPSICRQACFAFPSESCASFFLLCAQLGLTFSNQFHKMCFSLALHFRFFPLRASDFYSLSVPPLIGGGWFQTELPSLSFSFPIFFCPLHVS